MILTNIKLIILMLITTISTANASKLNWQVKREIGEITLWKSPKNTSFHGSTHTIKGKKEIFHQKDKDAFIKGLEDKKKQGLSYLGVTNWTAKKYKWEKEKLTITGYYNDTKNIKTYFKEVIHFKKNRQINLLLTSHKNDSFSDENCFNFFKITTDWENSK